MEQKDYILREIEKIGLMLRMLFDKIKHRDLREPESLELRKDEVLMQLTDATGFEVGRALNLEGDAFDTYLSSLHGFSIPNMELLADVMMRLGSGPGEESSQDYLKCALRLYEFCKNADRNYAMDREQKIRDIKKRFPGDPIH
jgi:hypothetical protein